jgi:hypothetical protein
LQEEIDFKVNRLKERMEVANEKLSESRWT